MKKMSRRLNKLTLLALGVMLAHQNIALAQSLAPTFLMPTFPLPVRVLGEAGGGRIGIFEGDGMVPLYGDANQMFYVDVDGRYGTDSSWFGSAGLGFRSVFRDWLLGGYVFGDRDVDASDGHFWVINPGIELMDEHWDAHVNAYFPTKKTDQISDEFRRQPFFTGNERIIQPLADFSVVGNGVDAEVGYSMPYKGERARVYLGGYYYNPSEDVDKVGGVEGGVEVPLFRRTTLTLSASYDQVEHTQGKAMIRYRFGGITQKPSATVEQRFLDPIYRHVGTLGTGAGIISQEETLKVGEFQLLQRNLFFFVPGEGEGDDLSSGSLHPFSSSSAGGEGRERGSKIGLCTFEHPCEGLSQSIIDKLPSSAFLYLAPGTYAKESSHGFALREGQSIFGRTANYEHNAKGRKRALVDDTLSLNGDNLVQSLRVDGRSHDETGAQSGIVILPEADQDDVVIIDHANVTSVTHDETDAIGLDDLGSADVFVDDSSFKAIAKGNADATAAVLNEQDDLTFKDVSLKAIARGVDSTAIAVANEAGEITIKDSTLKAIASGTNSQAIALLNGDECPRNPYTANTSVFDSRLDAINTDVVGSNSAATGILNFDEVSVDNSHVKAFAKGIFATGLDNEGTIATVTESFIKAKSLTSTSFSNVALGVFNDSGSTLVVEDSDLIGTQIDTSAAGLENAGEAIILDSQIEGLTTGFGEVNGVINTGFLLVEDSEIEAIAQGDGDANGLVNEGFYNTPEAIILDSEIEALTLGAGAATALIGQAGASTFVEDSELEADAQGFGNATALSNQNSAEVVVSDSELEASTQGTGTATAVINNSANAIIIDSQLIATAQGDGEVDALISEGSANTVIADAELLAQAFGNTPDIYGVRIFDGKLDMDDSQVTAVTQGNGASIALFINNAPQAVAEIFDSELIALSQGGPAVGAEAGTGSDILMVNSLALARADEGGTASGILNFGNVQLIESDVVGITGGVGTSGDALGVSNASFSSGNGTLKAIKSNIVAVAEGNGNATAFNNGSSFTQVKLMQSDLIAVTEGDGDAEGLTIQSDGVAKVIDSEIEVIANGSGFALGIENSAGMLIVDESEIEAIAQEGSSNAIINVSFDDFTALSRISNSRLKAITFGFSEAGVIENNANSIVKIKGSDLFALAVGEASAIGLDNSGTSIISGTQIKAKVLGGEGVQAFGVSSETGNVLIEKDSHISAVAEGNGQAFGFVEFMAEEGASTMVAEDSEISAKTKGLGEAVGLELNPNTVALLKGTKISAVAFGNAPVQSIISIGGQLTIKDESEIYANAKGDGFAVNIQMVTPFEVEGLNPPTVVISDSKLKAISHGLAQDGSSDATSIAGDLLATITISDSELSAIAKGQGNAFGIQNVAGTLDVSESSVEATVLGNQNTQAIAIENGGNSGLGIFAVAHIHDDSELIATAEGNGQAIALSTFDRVFFELSAISNVSDSKLEASSYELNDATGAYVEFGLLNLRNDTEVEATTYGSGDANGILSDVGVINIDDSNINAQVKGSGTGASSILFRDNVNATTANITDSRISAFNEQGASMAVLMVDDDLVDIEHSELIAKSTNAFGTFALFNSAGVVAVSDDSHLFAETLGTGEVAGVFNERGVTTLYDSKIVANNQGTGSAGGIINLFNVGIINLDFPAIPDGSNHVEANTTAVGGTGTATAISNSGTVNTSGTNSCEVNETGEFSC